MHGNKHVELSVLPYDDRFPNEQLLLSLAKSIFEETLTLDLLIKKIITKAQALLKSNICRVYLVDFERQAFEVMLALFTQYFITETKSVQARVHGNDQGCQESCPTGRCQTTTPITSLTGLTVDSEAQNC